MSGLSTAAANSEAEEITKAHKLLQLKRTKPQRCLVCDATAYNFCTGCHLAYYCSRSHQLSDWTHHRVPCHFAKRHPELRAAGYVIPKDISVLGTVDETRAAASESSERPRDKEREREEKQREKDKEEKQQREKEHEKAKVHEETSREPKEKPGPGRPPKKQRRTGGSDNSDTEKLTSSAWLSLHPEASISEIHGITEHAITGEKFLYVTWRPPFQTDPARCTLLALRDATQWMKQVLTFLENRVRVVQERDTITSSDWKQYQPVDGYLNGDSVSRIHGVRFRTGTLKTPYFLVTWNSDNRVAWLRAAEVYSREGEKALAFYESRLRISASAKIRT